MKCTILANKSSRLVVVVIVARSSTANAAAAATATSEREETLNLNNVGHALCRLRVVGAVLVA